METSHVLVRYGDIGTKSEPVRSRMINVLRQRIVDRLEYDDLEYSKVRTMPGRILVENVESEAVEAVAETPGVASASPAKKTTPEIEVLRREASQIEVGHSFGVDTRRSGQHGFDSEEVNREVGAAVEEATGAKVDLDDPDTWINIDIRDEEAFIFTETVQGTSGIPVGSSNTLTALISGGIDSPVAAHEVMKRGCDIKPVYFYNRPVSAEDHLMRFEASLKKLERFHPSKDWSYYVVDMEEVNKELMELGSGRMLVHRYVMFCVAEELSVKDGNSGIVTGEAISQKSSQTPDNLELTSNAIDLPIHRPLLTESKIDITEKARRIGTFEEASIDSACRSLSPENPATRMSENEFNNLLEKASVEELVEKALNNVSEEEL